MSSDIKSQLQEIIVQSQHKFALNLYKVLATGNKNALFSPLSIYIVLVLAHLGAKGDTADELEKYLHLPRKKEDLIAGITFLLENLESSKLNTATKIFIEQKYKVRSEYKENVQNVLKLESQVVNFQSAFEETIEIINQWVSSKTNNKINNLIPEGTLNSFTKLVLLNAIHFKDEWFKKFKQHDTYKQPFFQSKENYVEVDMMHITDHFPYVQNELFKALQLPYTDERFKMLILLPNEVDRLPALEQALIETNLLSLLDSMDYVKVNVALPKFKLEKFVDLNEALEKMGIKTMFTSDADFTGIHESTEQGLCVSKVLHKAFVEIDERGTEAAAATGLSDIHEQGLRINQFLYKISLDATNMEPQ